MAKDVNETPLMRQYNEYKNQYPDALLLFRIGDFYEMFGDDAKKASASLGLTLTKRNNGAAADLPLAGFPHHCLDLYLPKLVRRGFRVAICDQVEDPKLTNKLVKRDVTRVVTKGTVTEDSLLVPGENTYLCAIFEDDKTKIIGISFLDLSTGEFLVYDDNSWKVIDRMLANYNPKEILLSVGEKNKFKEKVKAEYTLQEVGDWTFRTGRDKLLEHFGSINLKGYGVDDMAEAQSAAGSIIQYLHDTKHNALFHINTIKRIDQSRYLWIDRSTIKSLELFESSDNEGERFDLFSVIDRTKTPMGKRMLLRWTMAPLRDVGMINARLDGVKSIFKNREIRTILTDSFPGMSDLDRLAGKIGTNRVAPRELISLCRTMDLVEQIKIACSESQEASIKDIGNRLNTLDEMTSKILETIKEDAGQKREGSIKSGVSEELDKWKELANNGSAAISRLVDEECLRTGIRIKICEHQTFGHLFDVPNSQHSFVPNDWIRVQTLKNSERYTSASLKELEYQLVQARDKIGPLEEKIYNDLVSDISQYIEQIQADSKVIARTDCLLSFVDIAEENRYVCPIVDDSDVLDIKGGRHPVIERHLHVGQEYVPNDVYLDRDNQQIMIITGPNMAGKSALLRQTALIVLLAQMGSYVPADSARIGFVDKIFTRVGASDNISGGESTFMVEMSEASNIINNVTTRSLVLFDELGRGTSTYDGISIAWSIVQYLHESEKATPRTLFATHYHELNEMENTYKRIKNFNVSVKESDGKVIFLRKLQRGGSEHSFGIHVARLSGMPSDVVSRAEEILDQLESRRSDVKDIGKEDESKKNSSGTKISFVQIDDPIYKRINNIILACDINSMTPIDALKRLADLKEIVTSGR